MTEQWAPPAATPADATPADATPALAASADATPAPAVSAAAQARIDRLRGGTTSSNVATLPTNRGRRRHPALGGRIAAVGFGIAAMLGVIGVLGWAHRATAVKVPKVPTPDSQTPVDRGTVVPGEAAPRIAPSVVAPAPASPTVVAATHGSR